jgi:hypothetical protein
MIADSIMVMRGRLMGLLLLWILMEMRMGRCILSLQRGTNRDLGSRLL